MITFLSDLVFCIRETIIIRERTNPEMLRRRIDILNDLEYGKCSPWAVEYIIKLYENQINRLSNE